MFHMSNEQASFILISLCLIAGTFQLIFLRTYWVVIRPDRNVESQVVPTKLAMMLHIMAFVTTCIVCEGRIIAWHNGTEPTLATFQWMIVIIINTILAYLFNQYYRFRLFLASGKDPTRNM